MYVPQANQAGIALSPEATEAKSLEVKQLETRLQEDGREMLKPPVKRIAAGRVQHDGSASEESERSMVAERHPEKPKTHVRRKTNKERQRSREKWSPHRRPQFVSGGPPPPQSSLDEASDHEGRGRKIPEWSGSSDSYDESVRVHRRKEDVMREKSPPIASLSQPNLTPADGEPVAPPHGRVPTLTPSAGGPTVTPSEGEPIFIPSAPGPSNSAIEPIHTTSAYNSAIEPTPISSAYNSAVEPTSAYNSAVEPTSDYTNATGATPNTSRPGSAGRSTPSRQYGVPLGGLPLGVSASSHARSDGQVPTRGQRPNVNPLDTPTSEHFSLLGASVSVAEETVMLNEEGVASTSDAHVTEAFEQVGSTAVVEVPSGTITEPPLSDLEVCGIVSRTCMLGTYIIHSLSSNFHPCYGMLSTDSQCVYMYV